jgi:hypothetical protein
MRSVILFLLFTLALRTAGALPAPATRPESTGRCVGLAKVLPLSLRYRQEIERRIHLPPREGGTAVPSAASPSSPATDLVRGDTFLPSGTALLLLLLRLQL